MPALMLRGRRRWRARPKGCPPPPVAFLSSHRIHDDHLAATTSQCGRARGGGADGPGASREG
uniref:Uncharacterized protein n=1 Tax=Oryza meridionalis TaxID=40149 RepID=A0A0E0C1L5_9ORYZ